MRRAFCRSPGCLQPTALIECYRSVPGSITQRTRTSPQVAITGTWTVRPPRLAAPTPSKPSPTRPGPGTPATHWSDRRLLSMICWLRNDMRIVLYTPAFLPRIGGLEINIASLAEQMTLSGHEIVVVTTTPGRSEEDENHPYRVVRCPSPVELLRWTRWGDVFFQANVSLRGLWPLLLVRRPWVVSHHSWYCRPDGRIAWRDRLKRYLLRYAAASLAVSQAMAQDLGGSTGTIQNPYRDQLFRILPGVERTSDLVFLGRLVSDKGGDVLLSALSILSREGLEPHLTIVGEGPEASRLEAHAEALDLTHRIEFLGKRQGPELVEILNRHRLMVEPSRDYDPFGIVALDV